MNGDQAKPKPGHKPSRGAWIGLGAILILFAVTSTVGITWGLPSRAIDRYLFGNAEPWSGERIQELAGKADWASPLRGADVDVDPLDKSHDRPIRLTATERDVAQICRRYRLYTYQPDEMITMRSLAGMHPRSLKLDPRLYQYGGLFIYPVGALIGACGAVGLIDVRGDVAYYLDHPDAFGRFYVAARGYAAAWGLVGVLVVFAIARRLGGVRAGYWAALLFTLMPVVVCMAHEGKPHLPGAVLMLMAVWFAMRCIEPREDGATVRGAKAMRSGGQVDSCCGAFATRDWWLMCACCGAALGMVLSSLPVFILIPLVAWMTRERQDPAFQRHRRTTDRADCDRGEDVGGGSSLARAVWRSVAGVGVGGCVYLITNPYIVINAVSNREVLRSNFGNSLAMYEVSRVGEGLVRVLELTIEGATLPVLVLGAVALLFGVVRRNAEVTPLAVVGGVLFLQFVLIGAGKPGEYGRFGVFTNTALAIGAACVIAGIFARSLATGCRQRGDTAPSAGGESPNPPVRGGVSSRPSRAVLAVIVGLMVVAWTGARGGVYLWNFYADTTPQCTRLSAARELIQVGTPVGVLAEPAPYGCPPMDFSRTAVSFHASEEAFARTPGSDDAVLIHATDEAEPWRSWRRIGGFVTPISWANKPIRIDASTQSP